MQLDFYVNFPNEAEQEGRTSDRAAHSSLSRNNVNTNKRVEEEADRRRAAGHGASAAPHPTGRSTGNRTAVKLASWPGAAEKPKNARPPSRPAPLFSKRKGAPAFHSYDIPHERASTREARTRRRTTGDGLLWERRGGRGGRQAKAGELRVIAHPAVPLTPGIGGGEGRRGGREWEWDGRP